MSSPYLDIRGNPIPQDQILGSGNSAVVLLKNGVAVKTPLRYLWSSDSDVEVNIESLRHEQEIYRRLQSVEDERSEGVVRCIGFSDEATQLVYMANGDLRTYLAKCRPSPALQLAWFRKLARTLSYIHDRCILVTDIATRNILLDSNLSLKFCDFSEASLLPLGSNMETIDDNGFTTQIDIGLLGTVMYEIVTGNKYQIDLFRNNSPTDGRAYWPGRKSLPSTQDIWLGWVIEGCWDGRFRSAHSLLQALDSVDIHSSSPFTQSRITNPFFYFRDRLKHQPATTIIGSLALTVFALMVGKRFSLVSRTFYGLYDFCMYLLR